MSLTVSPQLLERAQDGEVTTEEFVDCIRTSLPYGYTLVAELTNRLRAGDTQPEEPFVANRDELPSAEAQGQVLRMMASDSMRAALEKHFDVRLAFQNCRAVAVFPTGPEADKALEIFTSARAQLLNQSPELVDC